MHKLMMVAAGLLAICSVSIADNVSGKGPNGGRMAHAGSLHVEFLTKGVDVFVHAYDHDNKPLPSAALLGKLTIQEKGKVRTADLKPEGSNQLVGKLDTPLTAGARVIVSITPKDGKPVQARYTVQ